MKRICTLIGSIVALVFDVIYAVFMLIGIAAILELLGGSLGSITVAIVGILEIVIGVLAALFNGMALPLFNCSHEKYTKKKTTVVLSIVFNAILTVLCLISFANAISLLSVLVLLASIAAIVLDIVDMVLENKRYTDEVVTVEADKGE